MAATTDLKHDSMLLLTLGEVSELVSHSHDLDETLANIVRHIQGRFCTDVCSVYLAEKESGDLVLRATVGLRPESVGKVRMSQHEGLTGLVAEHKAPVAVEDAPKHPRFRYFPESGEERYHSFLGVPMIQGGRVQGVLVVQHAEPRQFSAGETHMLVGVAAQLAILVTNAQLTRELSETVRREEGAVAAAPPRAFAELHGTKASSGCALGRALCFAEFDFSNPDLVARPPGALEDEKRRLRDALAKGRDDIDRAAQHLAQLLGGQFADLMQAQRLMLEDKGVLKELTRRVEKGASAEQAIVTVCNRYLQAFKKLDNPFFYERIYDVKDVFRRVLAHSTPPTAEQTPGDPVIVVAHEVSLLELFASDLERVRGIVVEKGGAFSHVAILARSLGVPMLTDTPRLMETVRNADEVFLDADSAVVYVNPDEARQQVFRKLVDDRKQAQSHHAFPGAKPPLRLEATVNLLPEIVRTVEFGADAVGLYRSEFLELARRDFPSEVEQLDVYRKMLRILDGRPLTLRTFDLRPDKLFGIASQGEPSGQSWEWQLVDQLPNVQDVIRTQLRAALRAALDGPMRILFPMVTTQRQFDVALRLLEEARQGLRAEGLPFATGTLIGVMIEVPAAALMVRKWAKLVDFLCVGSNDLLHSLLGLERSDDRLLQLKTPLDPSYLRVVRHIIRAAHRAGRQVTICGEAASNPRAALALYALGADALSVPPDQLDRLRRVFAERTMPACRDWVGQELLRVADVEEVERVLETHFPEASASS